MTTSTRGRHPARNINTGGNELLSQSDFMAEGKLMLWRFIICAYFGVKMVNSWTKIIKVAGWWTKTRSWMSSSSHFHITHSEKLLIIAALNQVPLISLFLAVTESSYYVIVSLRLFCPSPVRSVTLWNKTLQPNKETYISLPLGQQTRRTVGSCICTETFWGAGSTRSATCERASSNSVYWFIVNI